jgi:hypothetical protein
MTTKHTMHEGASEKERVHSSLAFGFKGGRHVAQGGQEGRRAKGRLQLYSRYVSDACTTLISLTSQCLS